MIVNNSTIFQKELDIKQDVSNCKCSTYKINHSHNYTSRLVKYTLNSAIKCETQKKKI